MRAPGAILLISCYELGRQPLGVAWPAAFLRQAGFDPEVLDLAVDPLDEHKARAAQLVGISVPMHTALRLGTRAAERIRHLNPTCYICFYGLYALLNADYLLQSVADSIIGGEYETALVSLVTSLEAQGPGQPVEGVTVPGRPAPPVLKRLPFPLPDRRGLPALNRYAQLDDNGHRRLAGYVEASRGCLHHCLHCPIPPVYGGRFFVIPKEVVLADIHNVVRVGAQHISFGDPDFLNGPGHSLAIIRAMHREFPDLTFDFTAKIEHILKHRTIFPELATLGCLFVISAVESLSDTVLTHLHKGHTRQDVFDALAILRQVGIALRPSWVAFTPWTTLDDYLDMLTWIEEEGLVDHVDPVHYSIRLLVPPGSSLLSQGEIQPFLGLLDQANFYYRWTHPDPRMDKLQKQVARLVEEAARVNEDPLVTFSQIKRLAGTNGFQLPPLDRKRPPRLTETWFCCAEPTQDQLKVTAKV
ncbi:MAG: radical SAM protein [Elusimicrobia bacterium]|nr:radical SAM protein [Elusimicrobiota bacterium]